MSSWVQATSSGSSTSQRVSYHARQLTPPAVIAYAKERSPLFRGNATSLSNAALIRKGVFKNFFIFFRRAICHKLNARLFIARIIHIDIAGARVYQSVYQLSIKGLSIFFYRKNSTQYPTPPMSPKHHLSTRPKISVMQSTRDTITVVESGILLD